MSSPCSRSTSSPASAFTSWSPPIPMCGGCARSAARSRAGGRRGTRRSRGGSWCRRGCRRRRGSLPLAMRLPLPTVAGASQTIRHASSGAERTRGVAQPFLAMRGSDALARPHPSASRSAAARWLAVRPRARAGGRAGRVGRPDLRVACVGHAGPGEHDPARRRPPLCLAERAARALRGLRPLPRQRAAVRGGPAPRVGHGAAPLLLAHLARRLRLRRADPPGRVLQAGVPGSWARTSPGAPERTAPRRAASWPPG